MLVIEGEGGKPGWSEGESECGRRGIWAEIGRNQVPRERRTD